MAGKRTFWFTEENVRALQELTTYLQQESPVKVSQAGALHWAVSRALQDIKGKTEKASPEPPAPSLDMQPAQPRGYVPLTRPAPKPGAKK
jgi:hypothetical protein